MSSAARPGRNRVTLRLDVLEPEELSARFALETKEALAAVTVEDEGPSLSDEAFARLARPVESLKKEGLGLGLTIVKHILEAHGGYLRFERCGDPEGGLRAVLLLPTADAEAGA